MLVTVFVVVFLLLVAAISLQIRQVLRRGYNRSDWLFPTILAVGIGFSGLLALLVIGLACTFDTDGLAFFAASFLGLMLAPLGDALFLIWAAKRQETVELKAEIRRLRGEEDSAAEREPE